MLKQRIADLEEEVSESDSKQMKLMEQINDLKAKLNQNQIII